MRVGISRISASAEQAYAVLEAARDHGFEGVQLKPAQYRPFLGSPSAFGDHYGSLADLACGGLIAYPGGEPARWGEHLAEILPFAAAVRAEHICVCADVFNTAASDEQIRSVAEALGAIGQSARRQGMVISIHNHVNSLVETEDDIARLLDRLDPAVCGLTLDTAHAAKAGISDVHRLIGRFRSHLLNVHLKDMDAQGHFCALGAGSLQVEPVLAALDEVGYAQWLIVDEETASLDTQTSFGIAAATLTRLLPGRLTPAPRR